NVVSKRSSGIEEIGSVNWSVFVALLVLDLVVFAVLIKGYQYMGKIAYVSYGIILKTWIAALVQTCYAMEVGYGGILTMASYNRRSNNCY
ncbi:hypothetical protein OSTOST_23849, partial [Ostertagia ostertagi]